MARVEVITRQCPFDPSSKLQHKRRLSGRIVGRREKDIASRNRKVALHVLPSNVFRIFRRSASFTRLRFGMREHIAASHSKAGRTFVSLPSLDL
jgi:hypothetical protein